MGPSMLWIHIGMPKTGTTSLQSYLHKNPDLLKDHGVHYMVTGRDRNTGKARLICHNSMAVAMSRGWRDLPEAEADAFCNEYADHNSAQCIISSEMFFGRDLTPLQDRYLSRVDGAIRVIVYLRRFDDFVEADYKQRAKNGRVAGTSVTEFVRQRIDLIERDADYMNFETTFERIRQTIPGADIVPRLYLREDMVGNNVITDFLSVVGISPEHVALPEVTANRSLSRLASEAVGMLGPSAGFDTKMRRRLGRALQARGDARLFGRNDVLTAEECDKINGILEARNAGMRQAFFPERKQLFPELKDKYTGPERGHPDELAEFQYAMRIVLQVMAKST